METEDQPIIQEKITLAKHSKQSVTWWRNPGPLHDFNVLL